jgi:hypothetical protein
VTYRVAYDRLRFEGFIAGSRNDGYRANVRLAIKHIRNKFRAWTPHLTRSRTTAASDTAGASHPRGIDERHPFPGRWYLCSRWCFEKLASLSFAARCPSARQVDRVFEVNQPQDDRGKTSRSERTDE